jgi:WD40 repeat protein
MNVEDCIEQKTSLPFGFIPILQVYSKQPKDKIKSIFEYLINFNQISENCAKLLENVIIEITSERRDVFRLIEIAKAHDLIQPNEDFVKFDVITYKTQKKEKKLKRWIERQKLITLQFEQVFGNKLSHQPTLEDLNSKVPTDLLYLIPKIQEAMIMPGSSFANLIKRDFETAFGDRKDRKHQKREPGDKYLRVENLLNQESLPLKEKPFFLSACDTIRRNPLFKNKIKEEFENLRFPPIVTKLQESAIFAGTQADLFSLYPDFPDNTIVLKTLEVGKKFICIDSHNNLNASASITHVDLFTTEGEIYNHLKSFTINDTLTALKISKLWLTQGNCKGRVTLLHLDDDLSKSFSFDAIPTNLRASKITALDFLNDKLLLTGGSDQFLKAWDVSNTNHPIFEEKFNYTIQAIKCLDSNIFLAGDTDGTIRLFDWRVRKCVHSTFLLELTRIQAFDLTSICAASKRGCLLLYDLRQNQLTNPMTFVKENCSITSIDCNHHKLVYGTQKGRIHYLKF